MRMTDFGSTSREQIRLANGNLGWGKQNGKFMKKFLPKPRKYLIIYL